MVIAVLGWGSLIWNHGSLPLGSGWFEDGPEVALEFSRQSNDGRLTLVVHGEVTQTVLWAKLDVKDKSEAIEALRKREGTYEKHIGWSFNGKPSEGVYAVCHSLDIDGWVKSKGLQGVVWTALPPKNGTKNSNNGCARDLPQTIKYLSSLDGAQKDLAFEYIRRAPLQIRTPFRDEFERSFPELRPKDDT